MRGTRALHQLAASHGVQTSYRDVTGTRRDASPEALAAALAALGEPLAGPDDAAAALAARRAALARHLLEPVCVAWERQRSAAVRLCAPGGGTAECRLDLEGGRTVTWRRNLDRLPQLQDGGRDLPVRRLPLPRDLPRGYHRLHVALRGGAAGRAEGGSLVVVAPRRLYQGEDAAARRDWGVFLPVYAIRRDGDLGVGDLTGLERLGAWVGELGGTTVATLPLLAAFLYEDETYSPYGPASRLFWNELFVDPRRLPELERSPEAQRLLESDDLRREVAELSSARWIDYPRVAALKRRVLEPLARAFFTRDAPEARRAALAALRERRPELDVYAGFRALVERRGEHWPDWPAVLRDAGAGAEPDLDPEAYDPAAYRFHLYAQLAAEEQVRSASEACGGLYLDLPLGVAPTSFDAWRERDLFVAGASAGAPPDPLFSLGQDWGFHPVHPERQRLQGYRHLRAVLRHHLAHAGMLRVDHVMQLHRLFWIPRGVDKRQGVYVRYPAEELYAVLSLESHRTRTRVVGENLGTVPRYVDRALSRHGLLEMYVLPFEVDGRLPAGRLHRPVPADAVASANTHDMPTFRAFWEGADVDDRHDLGLLDAGEAEAERRGREAMRELWVRGLAESGHLAPREAAAQDGAAVLSAALASLGESASPLVLANLEDLWGELEPQNVPGTWRERPNWRRRAALTLEQAAADPRLAAVLARLDAARRGQAGPGTAPATMEERSQHSVHETGRNTMSDDTSRDLSRRPRSAGGAAVAEETHAGEPMQPLGGRSLLSDDDLHLFNEGRHFRLYDKLGAHRRELDGVAGYNFAVWAPDAESVHVVGDFNDWDRDAHPLALRGGSGIWEGFLPGAEPGAHYKFHVRSRFGGYRADKADPFAVRSEVPPKTGSVLWHLDHEWGDGAWMASRRARAGLDAPVSIYEVHLGSWRRVAEESDRYLTYREIAAPLAEHCKRHGFTHVELLPVMEHPFYGSWGYQTTGYFAPTSRYGTAQDLMAMIDHLHREGIGVVLDWVPSHFPSDEHGLGYFDGTHLFEHSDPRLGFHPDWNSFIFNYDRHEVRSFLVSSALFWLDKFHADGLRVDAVASMLYRDYSRAEGEWIPNRHGGRENLEAIELLRQLNAAVYERFPDVQTWAEESTAWPGVSRPTYAGGLGFGYKWDMGWMHDSLSYFAKQPVHRKFHQNELTFRMVYAWSESFTLPLSHDEVVHGKRSLLAKMPGDDWQKFANLRLLYGYMWAQPAKKLLFMGGEIGQWREWSHETSLDWHLLDEAPHQGISRWVADLNRAYREEPALHQLDCDPAGFEWVDTSDHENSVLSFLRLGRGGDGAQRGEMVLAVFNFTPVPRPSYRLGVPRRGHWRELLNSDAPDYGGSGQGNLGGVDTTPTPLHGRDQSLTLTLPPLGMLLLKGPGTA